MPSLQGIARAENKVLSFYITTPIYYLNGAPHLGHAYTTVITDALARFWQLWGHPTYFLTGTDEHGQKIVEAAQKASEAPEHYVDHASELFRTMTADVGADANDFIRTTEARHIKGAQAFWEKLTQGGWIYKGSYKGWYAVRDEAFYKESEIVDGKAPTGAPVSWVEEPCYFFKLSAFQDKLLDFYAKNPDFIVPHGRFNEAKRWVEQGLQDLAISRSTFKWGVPVPGDADHIMYVWIDALSNYITALGYPDHTNLMQTFWPHARHVIGKDILRFHGIYWPAFLMAAGLEPPKQLLVHGWWTVEGEKMSKSLNNVLAPKDLIGTYGLDPLRYFLLRHVPFGGDGNFSDEAMCTRLNSDLSNSLGNLLQRTLAFIHKRTGCVPHANAPTLSAALVSWMGALESEAEQHMTAAETHRYLTYLWQGVALGNQFIDDLAPWILAKSKAPEDQERLANGLRQVLDTLYTLARYLQPIIPESARKILAQLGYEGPPLALRAPSFQLKGGRPLPKPAPLFEKREQSV